MDAVFKVESFGIFQNVAQDLLSELYYSNSRTNPHLEPETYEKAKLNLRSIILDCDYNLKNIVNLFNNKGWDEQRVRVFANLIEEKWPELIGAALSHYSSNYGETIINVDWIVKQIFGTSELKTLKYPLLQLLLTTVNKNGQQNKISYDIKKDMLLKIINVLENINR